MQHGGGKKKAGESSGEGATEVKEKQPAQGGAKPSERVKSSVRAKASSSEASQAATPSKKPDTFSINQALKKGRQEKPGEAEGDQQPEEEEEPSADTGKNRHHHFTQEELEKALKTIAGEYKDKPRISNMLASRKPQKQPDDLIHIHLENQLQQQQINRIYNTLLYRLKEELQNDAITLQTEIAREQQAGDKKLYTAEDKYLYMEKKNQYLKQLKQDFDLDFD